MNDTKPWHTLNRDCPRCGNGDCCLLDDTERYADYFDAYDYGDADHDDE